ncbi:hypothetical protein CHARACLAT_027654 [Characodon lateralis]|uniref:Uncharacterized protein n=1 Tax=Characodon lateralis TaxID=208331 RepID=A0ABU7E7D3_9TELE|nr:hypothetical protein [Characodon lateralis]
MATCPGCSLPIAYRWLEIGTSFPATHYRISGIDEGTTLLSLVRLMVFLIRVQGVENVRVARLVFMVRGTFHIWKECSPSKGLSNCGETCGQL